MINPASGMGRGIVFGTLAGATSLLLGGSLMAGEALSWANLSYVPVLAFFVLMAALVMVAAAAIFLGLPLVWALAEIDCAGAEMVAAVGALAGAAVFMVPTFLTNDADDPFNWVLIIAALIGGGVTGAVWGARLDREEADDLPLPNHPNRIHDPRMLR